MRRIVVFLLAVTIVCFAPVTEAEPLRLRPTAAKRMREAGIVSMFFGSLGIVGGSVVTMFALAGGEGGTAGGAGGLGRYGRFGLAGFTTLGLSVGLAGVGTGLFTAGRRALDVPDVEAKIVSVRF